MNEIQLGFYTLENLFSKDLWSRFFSDIESLLNVKLSYLDVNDPIRRKVAGVDDAAAYICAIGEQEGSRRVFGKFGKSRIEISISLFRDVSRFQNSVFLYFPEQIFSTDEGRNLVYDAFIKGNTCLRPFYSLCDFRSMIACKKKSSGFAVDLQAELIGLFWLTYFNKSYVEFLGQSRFDALMCEKVKLDNGVAIRLGASPFSLDLAREEAESLLGKESFVEPKLTFDKPIGKSALTFEQLKSRPQ